MKGIGSPDTDIIDCREEQNIDLNIDRSSQFLSALLMVLPVKFNLVNIKMTGNRSARAYVDMTEQMMKMFGHSGVVRCQGDIYQVRSSVYRSGVYQIEPDVSAACYFYAAAAVTGGSAVVKRVKKDSLQGDMKFLDVLQQMGCRCEWYDDGGTECLRVIGAENGRLSGIDVDMSDFSDQTLTLAAIAPYADSDVIIRGVGHIRGQESDRIHVIVTELGRMGIDCQEFDDGVIIHPGVPRSARINTYNDHRVAMSFAVTGLRTDGIEILNPKCCGKTFSEFFNVFDSIYPN